MSTAVSGRASWYSLPNSETEIEMKSTLCVGGARVIDSIECLHMLGDAKPRPVEDFDNPNIKFLCSGALKTPSEMEEEKYEYSYYSDGPSETNVSMEGVEIFGDSNG
ncbi:hypothetical protein ANCCEY_06135 [Ancylostoma ceylanicum]|nr:hypothetical protein ANCCEY_06135 [Ancylostoma ceylanicum]